MMNTKNRNSEGPWWGILLGVVSFFGGALDIWNGPPYIAKGGLPAPEATNWLMMLFGVLMTAASIRRLLRERRERENRQAASPAEPEEETAPENGEPPEKSSDKP